MSELALRRSEYASVLRNDGFDALLAAVNEKIAQLEEELQEQIEVISEGASALYGANAAGGVINIVTRKDFEGRVWGPSQRVSVAQALRVCTVNSAYASFEEKIKGSIT